MSKRLSALLNNTLDMALKRRARLIIGSIDPTPNDRILDAGCGDGYYLHLISSLGIKNVSLTGIDYDRRALASAKRNLGRRKVKFKVVDLMKKSNLKPNYYNKVIMSEVAEHLPNDVEGLKEIYRVMKKGGKLVLTVPNANYPFLWDPINKTLEFLFGCHIKSGFFAGIWNQHERLYTPERIRKVLKRAGFKVKEVKTLTFWCLPFNHYIINLGARILSKGVRLSVISGANKFKNNEPRSLVSQFYYFVANNVDKLNDFYSPRSCGVGVFLVAYK